MLLTLTDFPPGWVHLPSDPALDAQEAPAFPWAPCFVTGLDGQTGKAIGGEFSDENTTLLSVNPSVFVFDSATNAQVAAGTIMANVQCLANSIGDGVDLDDGNAFAETYTEDLDPDLFDASDAIRYFNTQIYKSRPPPNSDVLVFDIVIVVDGRVVYEIDGFQRHSPIDRGLLKTYVDKARDRIGQQP